MSTETVRGVALVTGAGGGIGRGIAMTLAAAGWAVAACDIDERAQATVDGISAAGGKAVALAFDVTDATAAARAHEQAANGLGPVGLVVANAGIVDQVAFAHRLDPRGWSRELDINLSGAFYTIRPALGGMRQRPGGRVIVISSVAALSGLPGQVAYTATKAGLLGLTRTLALELAPFAATANAVLPGFIATKRVLGMPAHIQERVVSHIPLRRFGMVEEVSALVAFLSSPAAAYITGACIPVDGGYLLHQLTLGRDP